MRRFGYLPTVALSMLLQLSVRPFQALTALPAQLELLRAPNPETNNGPRDGDYYAYISTGIITPLNYSGPKLEEGSHDAHGY